MLYRKFGKTGNDVSILGFGCMRLPIIGDDTTKIDEEKAIPMIRHAIDEGVNYIDTAYPYHGTGFDHGGESEPFLAKALKDGYRERVAIATKLPTWLITSREDMDRYLDEQLKRMDVEYIDYYLLHTLNKTSWENLKKHNIFDFMEKALASGRVRHIGFSFHGDLTTFKEIIDAYDWEFCQIQYNYLDENYQAGREGLDYAGDRGIGVVIMEPLRGGSLANKIPPKVQEIFDTAPVKRTPVEWALRWIWDHPAISIILSGMTEMEHVTDNLRIAGEAAANSLSIEENKIMDQVKAIYKEKLAVDCTNCQYCMPCPFGVNIPGNFACYNDYYMFENMGAAKMMYTVSLGENHKASKCVECGKCEGHCPQNIPIISELKKVAALFETE